MKIIKPPFSISVIYWFTQVIFFLLLSVGLGAILFNILLYTDFFGDDLQLHAYLPAKVNFLEKGDLFLNGQQVKVELVEASTKIHFFNTPGFIAKKMGAALSIVVFMIIYLVFEFRKFISNVKKGNTFTQNNIFSLKKIAYGLVGLWLFSVVYFRLAYHYIATNLSFEQVVITDEVPYYTGILFLALFIWVLAHIFITGLKMKEEQDLTV